VSEPTHTADPPVDRVGHLIRTVVPLLGILVLSGLAARQATYRLNNDDTFFQLRFGQEFLDGWSLTDPGSVTEFGTRDWVPTQWAAQILMAGIEDVGGVAAVAWLAGVLYLSYALALYLACRQEAAPLIAVLVSATAFGASAQGLSARPQLFSFIFVTITVAAWLRTTRDGKVRWWLIALTWAWATLHGMWPVGVVIGMTVVLGAMLDGKLRGAALARQLAVPLGSVLAAGLTPVGPALLKEILVVGSRSAYFAEWGPTEFLQPQPLAFVVLLAAVVARLARSERADWIDILLVLQAAGWAIYSARTVPVAAALLAPVAARALAGLTTPADPRVKDRRVAVGAWAAGIAVLALLTPRTVEVGLERPEWQDAALADLPEGEPLLSEWGWGGFLMWKHPQLELVIHGYGDVFTTEELDRNVRLTRLRPEWIEDVERTGARYALLDPESPLAYALVESLDWTVVHESDEAELLRAPDSSG
jgi:hypothetical protein